jgi:hypothetical protein
VLPTEAMVAAPPPVDPAAWHRSVEGLPRVLAGLAGASNGPRPWRITGFDVRRAAEGPPGWAEPDQPFAWSARTAQRLIGLSALRSLVAGTARAPAHAVRDVVAELSGGGHLSTRTPTSLEQWMAALPPAGRATVGAAAVTWVTRLWSGLDWVSLVANGPIVIGRDHWWDSPHTSLLALRSRAEVRSGRTHLVVLNGARRRSAETELCLVALTETLRGGVVAAPVTVVGWWPDSGHVARIDACPAVLDRGVAAVAAVLRARRSALAA